MTPLPPFLRFVVDGGAIPEGSMVGFPNPHGGRVVVVASNKSKLHPWRRRVAEAARAAIEQIPGWTVPLAGPVWVRVDCTFYRPGGHVGQTFPIVKGGKTAVGDVDKLVRGVLDALTGVVFVDDSQVVMVTGTKDYGPAEACRIVVGQIERRDAGI